MKEKKTLLYYLCSMFILFGIIAIIQSGVCIFKQYVQIKKLQSLISDIECENNQLKEREKDNFNLYISKINEEIEKNDALQNKINNIKANHISDALYAMELIEPLKETNKEQYYLLYKDIKEHYKDITDNPETVYDYYSDEQIHIMWKCIETETFGCPFDAKVNVANVILNRVDDIDFPSDPIKVVTKENQFSYGRSNISEDTKLALEYAFEIEDTTNKSIGFKSGTKLKKWNGWDYQFTDNVGHHFYKKGGEDI